MKRLQTKAHKKRLAECEKANDEFYNRLRVAEWETPTSDWNFRLRLLMFLIPGRSTRQNFNLAKTNRKII